MVKCRGGVLSSFKPIFQPSYRQIECVDPGAWHLISRFDGLWWSIIPLMLALTLLSLSCLVFPVSFWIYQYSYFVFSALICCFSQNFVRSFPLCLLCCFYD